VFFDNLIPGNEGSERRTPLTTLALRFVVVNQAVGCRGVKVRGSMSKMSHELKKLTAVSGERREGAGVGKPECQHEPSGFGVVITCVVLITFAVPTAARGHFILFTSSGTHCRI